jgi:hypothetical protein
MNCGVRLSVLEGAKVAHLLENVSGFEAVAGGSQAHAWVESVVVRAPDYPPCAR